MLWHGEILFLSLRRRKWKQISFFIQGFPKGITSLIRTWEPGRKKSGVPRGKVELDLYLMIPEKLNALLEQTEGHCSVENTFSKFVSQATDSRCVFSLFTLNRTAPSWLERWHWQSYEGILPCPSRSVSRIFLSYF